METGLTGFDEIEIPGAPDKAAITAALSKQTPDRMRVIAQAMRHGLTNDEIQAVTAGSIPGSWPGSARSSMRNEGEIRTTVCRPCRGHARAEDAGLYRRAPRTC